MVMRDRGYTFPHPSLPDLEGNGWSEKGLTIKWLVPPAPRAVVELVKCGCKGECKGNFTAQRMDWPAHLFANAMQLVAATIWTTTGMIKTMTRRRRRTMTDCSSSAKSLVNQYMPVLIRNWCGRETGVLPPNVQLSACVLNWRGTPSNRSTRELRDLGMTKRDWHTISGTVLEGGVITISAFRRTTTTWPGSRL